MIEPDTRNDFNDLNEPRRLNGTTDAITIQRLLVVLTLNLQLDGMVVLVELSAATLHRRRKTYT